MGWWYAKWWFDYITKNVDWEDLYWDVFWLIPDTVDWFVKLFN